MRSSLASPLMMERRFTLLMKRLQLALVRGQMPESIEWVYRQGRSLKSRWKRGFSR